MHGVLDRSHGTSRPSDGKPPLPDTPPNVPGLESLDETGVWVGTFRERLRIARAKEQPKLEAAVKELEIHRRRRRDELS